MNPIVIILYAVVVTLVLTLLVPRFGTVSPAGMRLLRVAMLAGIAALVVAVVLLLIR